MRRTHAIEQWTWMCSPHMRSVIRRARVPAAFIHPQVHSVTGTHDGVRTQCWPHFLRISPSTLFTSAVIPFGTFLHDAFHLLCSHREAVLCHVYCLSLLLLLLFARIFLFQLQVFLICGGRILNDSDRLLTTPRTRSNRHTAAMFPLVCVFARTAAAATFVWHSIRPAPHF